MIDGNEADDKIIAVLFDDLTYGHIEDITDCPPGIVDRLKHYFLSYKQLPQEAPRRVEIADVYNRDEAHDAITRSLRDYRERYGAPESRVSELRKLLR
jgi:inorganic pyrophosphatase